jgi:NAD(P)-dependent dehydrogenase (short-subunit alcohol dehydrogenase family)
MVQHRRMETVGKTVLVTGSGGAGSGRAIAKRFARNGARVVVSDIDDEGGAATVEAIAAQGGTALYRRADVRSEGAVRDLIAFTQRSFGPLGVMVNNASGPEYRPNLPLEFCDEIIATELLGAMYGIRHAIEAMREHGGAIVNVSSTSALEFGRLRPGGSPAYDAAKAGILHLTMMLRFLAETNGTRVNCVVPHWIASPGPKEYYNSLTPEEREALGVPAKLISLEEMAEALH